MDLIERKKGARARRSAREKRDRRCAHGQAAYALQADGHAGTAERTSAWEMIESSHDPFRQQHKIVPCRAIDCHPNAFATRPSSSVTGPRTSSTWDTSFTSEEARSLGDMLVVTITADRHITKKRSVSFSEEYRARQLAALEIVDYVAIVDEPSAGRAIERLRPDVYVKGAVYAHLMLDKQRTFSGKKIWSSVTEAACISRGVRLPLSTKLVTSFASSEASQDNPLLRNDRVMFRDLGSWAFTLEQLKDFLAAASGLRVCLLGETIIDEWVDVTVTNSSRRSRGASQASKRRGAGRSAAPAALRCIWPVSSKSFIASRTGSPPAPVQRHGLFCLPRTRW